MLEQLKKLQKDTGIKMGQYDNIKNMLYHQGQILIKAVETYVKAVEEAEMTGEQFFITFEDILNEISVKDHNADSE